MGNQKSPLLGTKENGLFIDDGTMCRAPSPSQGSIGLLELDSLFFAPSLFTAPNFITHVVVAFEGWNAPWEKDGGKEIPLGTKTTIVRVIESAKKEFEQKNKRRNENVEIVAYATDTDDDVKTKAIEFINNKISKDKGGKQTGKLIIYGYSWGGDTAVELSADLTKKGHRVDLLITVDAALGPFNGPAVRDRTIHQNVGKNFNYYTTTPDSSVFSRGLPNWAQDSRTTKVINVQCNGPTHATMDEDTREESIQKIVEKLLEDETNVLMSDGVTSVKGCVVVPSAN